MVFTDGDSGDGEEFPGGIPSYCTGLTDARREGDVILLLNTNWDCIWWMECPTEVRFDGIRGVRTSTTHAERDGVNVPIVVEYDISNVDLIDQESIDGKEDSSCTSRADSPPTSDDEAEVSDSDIEDNGEDQRDDEEHEGEDEGEEEEEEELPEWIEDCYHPSWDIAEFFEKLKRQYRQLDFVPKSSTSVAEGWGPNSEGLVEELKSIYRKHGWPDLEVYRKEDCLKEVRNAVER